MLNLFEQINVSNSNLQGELCVSVYDNIYDSRLKRLSYVGYAILRKHLTPNSINNQVLNPLDQFDIIKLIALDAPIFNYTYISITNIILYLTVATLIMIALKLVSTNYNKVYTSN